MLKPLPKNCGKVILALTQAEVNLFTDYDGREFRKAVAEYLSMGNRIESLDTFIEYDFENNWYFITTGDERFERFLKEKGLRVWMQT